VYPYSIFVIFDDYVEKRWDYGEISSFLAVSLASSSIIRCKGTFTRLDATLEAFLLDAAFILLVDQLHD